MNTSGRIVIKKKKKSKSTVSSSKSSWSRLGLSVLKEGQSTQVMDQLGNCLRVGCLKNIHIIVGYNNVMRKLEKGDLAALGLVKGAPADLEGPLVASAALQGVVINIFGRDDELRLSKILDVNRVMCFGITKHGLSDSHIEVLRGSLILSNSQIQMKRSERRNKGIARKHNPVPLRTEEEMSDVKTADVDAELSAIHATLDGLRETMAKN
jgi:hypothetical protein